MKNITLSKVSMILNELTEDYADLYPKFKQIEIDYIKEYDTLMIKAQGMFSNQPSREAYVRQELHKMDKFHEYNDLLVRIKVIEVRMRTLTQISKNMISASWGESEVEYGK